MNAYRIGATVAATLAIASVAVAQAPPGARGQVTAIDTKSKTITLQGWGDQGSSTVKVSASTKYLVATTGSISDLKVGDSIMVMGAPPDDSGIVQARMIMVAPSGMGAHQHNAHPGGQGGQGGRRFGVQGVVATVSPTLTITTPDKATDTIATDDDTRVMTFKPGTLADVKVGTRVNAEVANGVATDVRVMPAGRGGFGGGHGGGGGGWGGHGGGGWGGGGGGGAQGGGGGGDNQ
ncbi:MAG: hypothetical protein ACLQVD_03480 [Capsulimonadaceae bacterium]